jgi:hypothetical protein
MSKNWTKIEDGNVRHIWIKDDACECDVRKVDVSPDWYQSNGTPICECGIDMEYSHTEIKT